MAGDMDKQGIVDEIGLRRVSAIIRTNDADLARKAMQAAVQGGFRMVEFTLTTPQALDLIEEFARDRDLLVGAGTVLSSQDARQAVSAGARFLVSPVTDEEMIEAADELGVASIPGTFTPTEMVIAERLGADLVKIFPAPADLVRFVTQIRGPLPHLKLFPTAGIDSDNFIPVLQAGAYGAGFVSSLFVPSDLAKRDFDAIEARAVAIHNRLHGASQ
ncbi:MAG: bifunctional 4-hydroxy-2-oxoglutarate aldolase/2-dehydro-3-deoxy-phosphogluconate aldolase [Candidatus Eisenbacteria bacterium]